MRTTGRDFPPDLVLAAQAGDRRALDELVATGLPLVYSIVRRALDGHPDADDVVQDTMLRAVRQLPALHHPESFRPWLAAIAVHQVSTHLHRRSAAARRAAPLDEAAGMPDADAEIEDLTMLQLELSGQRRQVTRASRWLDPDDRALLSLWWLETAGALTRAELAATLDVSIAHAAVRIQRMRQQLDVSRELVAALDATPRCAVLDDLVSGWDGMPSPLWRKRIARHTRTCRVCGHSAEGLISAERLLAGLALLPVPVALTASLMGKTALGATVTGSLTAAAAGTSGGVGATVKAGLFGQLVQAVVAHPVAAAVATAVAAGAAVTVVALPTQAPPSHGVQAAPSTAAAVRATPSTAPPATGPPPRPPATTTAAASSTPRTDSLAPGRTVSLESADQPGLFVTTADSLGVLAAVPADSTAATRQQATFTVLPGLADAACFSFRAEDGRYLRHSSWRFQLHRDEGTALFRGDATFCARAGATPGTILLEAQIYPGWFLHHRGDQLWVDQPDGSATFWTGSSFRVRPALTG
ncbi:sigma-70 family RNA polymerase sigma factor [Dactylosporangium sp. NBC_01737]|uniref:sigma-70 family RNA polymerase sigma factor n=1 Tax=Dactylosporangium sp. NBC_01737 TaxID=2975959 RepID=UPI002E15D137|nr:sigma-70 family RNA polymerase sigma factor [Dactylosporangium sp. NBC_01737]